MSAISPSAGGGFRHTIMRNRMVDSFHKGKELDRTMNDQIQYATAAHRIDRGMVVGSCPLSRAWSTGRRPDTSLAASGSQQPARQAEVAPPQVKKLAEMAQLGITEEEEIEWTPQIERIVEWFDQLQQIDVEGVSPSLRGGTDGAEERDAQARGGDGSQSGLRLDEPVEYEEREAMLDAVRSHVVDGFVVVPKTQSSTSGSNGE